MKTVPVSRTGRVLWGVMFVWGLVALVIGIVSMVSGLEMFVMTVLFGGLGLFLVLGSLGRLMGWER